MTFLKKLIISLIFLIVVTIINMSAIRGKYNLTIWSDKNDTGNMSISMSRDDIIAIEDFTYNPEYCYYSARLVPLKRGEVTFTYNNSAAFVDDTPAIFEVLPFGIIMQKGKVGSIGNTHIFRIEIIILLLLSAINISISIKKLYRENSYSYKIMYYLGGLTFIFVNTIFWTFLLITSINDSIAHTLFYLLNDIINDTRMFIILVLPFIFILAIFLIISNLVLIKKEGSQITNMLGIGLGISLILATAFIDVFLFTRHINANVSFFLDTLFSSFLSYFECIMIGTFVGTMIIEKKVPTFDKDYIIILGCSIKKDGTVTPLLRGRADRAIWFAREQKEKANKDIIFVPSGGQGSDEVISEAMSIKNYLLEKGIPEDKILLENKSTSTYENLKFSNDIIQKNADTLGDDQDTKIAFSTSGYHVFRAGHLANSMGINAEGIGNHTRWYFYINALIREFIANIASQKRSHIKNLIKIFVFVFLVHLIYFYI